MPTDLATSTTGIRWRRWLTAALMITPLLRWLVLVHLVPPEQPWQTTCPQCATPIHPGAGLAPLWPSARCGTCGHQIGARPYVVEASAVLVATTVLVAGWGRWAPEIVALGLWGAVVVVLSIVDLGVHRLPDRLTLPAAAGVLILLAAAAAAGGDGSWPRAALAAAACGAGFALVTLLAGERAFGLGDAKLALSAGALLGWIGWSTVLAGLFMAFLGSGVAAAILLITGRASRRDTLPFGPYLAAGTLLALALTPNT